MIQVGDGEKCSVKGGVNCPEIQIQSSRWGVACSNDVVGKGVTLRPVAVSGGHILPLLFGFFQKGPKYLRKKSVTLAKGVSPWP